MPFSCRIGTTSLVYVYMYWRSLVKASCGGVSRALFMYITGPSPHGQSRKQRVPRRFCSAKKSVPKLTILGWGIKSNLSRVVRPFRPRKDISYILNLGTTITRVCWFSEFFWVLVVRLLFSKLLNIDQENNEFSCGPRFLLPAIGTHISSCRKE